jgi:hypothetical protein
MFFNNFNQKHCEKRFLTINLIKNVSQRFF